MGRKLVRLCYLLMKETKIYTKNIVICFYGYFLSGIPHYLPLFLHHIIKTCRPHILETERIELSSYTKSDITSTSLVYLKIRQSEVGAGGGFEPPILGL